MKTLMIVATVVAGFVGFASAANAHRPTQASVECPSSRDWAKCVWQDINRNRGS
ncbi:MAG: hypothetical protein ACKVP3_12975 [Hyphomicrobiaceae bacterium]